MTRRTLAAICAPLLFILTIVVATASPGNPAAYLLAIATVLTATTALNVDQATE